MGCAIVLAAMALSQQKLREILLQLLYSHDFAHDENGEMISFLMSHHAVSKKNLYLAEDKKQRILAHLAKIDELIQSASSAYDLDRISKVEKNILRIGVFELCMTDDVPLKVAIAEAVRLARKFASPEGASYVNAVLDAISKGEECISKKEESSVS